jgi:HAD superfamily 5'-nucleotidase-like hydrolase
MDYTLVHYRVDEWERSAFEHARNRLAARGWPVEGISFEPDRFTLGLVFDLRLGNLVKATRFGYVVRALHGSTLLDFEDQRQAYAETVVELSDERFEFMNTMFELSRAALWTELVDAHDAGRLPGVSGYNDLYWQIDDALGRAHAEGALKAEILADPDRFIDPNPDIVPTLVDQRLAGKQIVLITNSDWAYTRATMARAIEPYCEPGTTWRDLFDLVIVSAAKPRFFSDSDPIYRVVDEERSLLQPHFGLLVPGNVYFGGNARLVEESLGLSAAQLLYVGDHLFGDVHVTKDVLRWRTALVAREIEAEVIDARAFVPSERRLNALMHRKVAVEQRQAELRMARRRAIAEGEPIVDIERQLAAIAAAAQQLDDEVAPLARAAARLGNPNWGPLMRAGNDKSLFARQVERYADIYLSRVSNLRRATPYAYLRAARGSLPHDPVGQFDDGEAR